MENGMDESIVPRAGVTHLQRLDDRAVEELGVWVVLRLTSLQTIEAVERQGWREQLGSPDGEADDVDKAWVSVWALDIDCAMSLANALWTEIMDAIGKDESGELATMWEGMVANYDHDLPPSQPQPQPSLTLIKGEKEEG